MTTPQQSGSILRARVVLPVIGPAIDNGAVFVSGNRIVAVDAFGELTAPAGTPVHDLGESILMPGLVNAHCHLEYTGMAGQVPAGGAFSDWLRRIIHLKRSWTEEQFRDSWREGARMLVDSGTTTVADIVSSVSLAPEVWTGSSVRVCGFLELTGLLDDLSAEDLAGEAVREAERLNDLGGHVGLSPHSLYATAKGLLPELGRAAAEKELWMTMHLAESDDEQSMFLSGEGPMYDWLREMGRYMSDCGAGSPVRLAERLGVLNHRMLAAHVNRLEEGDSEILASSSVSVVHCPGSHAFFEHSPFPYRELAEAEVNLCLGTDSLASINGEGNEGPRLNMFEEMRRFAGAFPDVRPEQIVRMATMNGAMALGMGSLVGELRLGALADCITIPHSGAVEAAYEAVVHSGSAPRDVMVAGEWAERNPLEDRQNRRDWKE